MNSPIYLKVFCNFEQLFSCFSDHCERSLYLCSSKQPDNMHKQGLYQTHRSRQALRIFWSSSWGRWHPAPFCTRHKWTSCNQLYQLIACELQKGSKYLSLRLTRLKQGHAPKSPIYLFQGSSSIFFQGCYEIRIWRYIYDNRVIFFNWDKN